MRKFLKRVFKFYWLEGLIFLLFLYPAVFVAYLPLEVLSRIAEDFVRGAIGLVFFYYPIRVLKVGFIDWDKDEKMKMWYAIALLIYAGLIFAD